MLAIFSAAETPAFFSAFEPSVFTIKSLAVPQGQVDMIRQGYIPSFILANTVGGIISVVTKRALPIILSIGMSIGMIMVYEGAIASVQISAVSEGKMFG